MEPGTHQLKLTLDTAAAQALPIGSASAAPLQFEMQAGQMDYRMFQDLGSKSSVRLRCRPLSSGRGRRITYRGDP
jgi:hypothetical protein